MLALRMSEIRDKYTGEVIGEVQEDTRRDLRAKIHRAFQAKGAVRRTSFEERAELGRRIARREVNPGLRGGGGASPRLDFPPRDGDLRKERWSGTPGP